jgi:hypothetical protein
MTGPPPPLEELLVPPEEPPPDELPPEEPLLEEPPELPLDELPPPAPEELPCPPLEEPAEPLEPPPEELELPEELPDLLPEEEPPELPEDPEDPVALASGLFALLSSPPELLHAAAAPVATDRRKRNFRARIKVPWLGRARAKFRQRRTHEPRLRSVAGGDGIAAETLHRR